MIQGTEKPIKNLGELKFIPGQAVLNEIIAKAILFTPRALSRAEYIILEETAKGDYNK
jgi:hypothetical protein